MAKNVDPRSAVFVQRCGLPSRVADMFRICTLDTGRVGDRRKWLVDKIDFRALISRRRDNQRSKKYSETRNLAPGSHSQSPRHCPVIPLRAAVYVCDHDHENPGSKEPAEVSDFVNLTT